MSLSRIFLALALFATSAVAADKPNVLIILTDDMGFSDLGCYGSEIRTPNLDALAAGGLRFTQFYNTARCCPTRAALLTGLYSHQAGVGHMMEDKDSDGYRGDLNPKVPTIAEALKPAGYRAYAVGKWHVTRFAGPKGPKHNWPLQRGFDHYYGTLGGAGSYFDPSTLTRDNTPISPFADPEYKPERFYYTDAITDNAIQFLRDHFVKDHKEQPFLMYVAYTAAHWPMHALPEDIERYHGKYDNGYEPTRKARFEKAAKLGLIDARQGISEMAGHWDKVPDKKWEARCMEVYAAMVDRMDQGVGKIVAELKRTGQLDNTLVLFLQDNGGCAEPMGRTGNKDHPNIARPEKPTFPPLAPEALLPPVSVPPQTRDGYPVRMGPMALPGTSDTYVAYGQAWANVSNTPFREYKHWVHKGGISTPLIAHWAKGIPAERNGQLVRDPGHLIDLMATCLDVAGAKPKDGAPKPEGVSLRPAFEGKALERAEPIYWEHEGNRAIRQGKWKLVMKYNHPWELHDMDADRVELHDLSAAEPARVSELSAAWEAWAKKVGVRPWDEIGGKKKK
jgi:arylsulfatase